MQSGISRSSDYDVVLDDNIPEGVNIDTGRHWSDVYLVPLSISTTPATELQCYTGDVSDLTGKRARDLFKIGNRMYSLWTEQYGPDRRLMIGTIQRLVIRTPQIVGVVQDVGY